MSEPSRTTELLSKVPPITLAFWVVKIFATTVGETGGDALSMTLELGYAISSLIFLAFFCVTAAAQISSRRYHPVFYWSVVVATTTVGTTTSDYLDRTLGLGYVKSSLLLFGAVLAVLLVWHRATGTIAADRITTRTNEAFYWVTILVSNTLGTALGDFVATSAGLGFERGALVFGGLIALVAGIHFFVARVPGAILFWAAYVLTRPLGATLGDLLTKPHAEGGLAFGRITSSLVLAAAMVLLVTTTSLGKRARAVTAAALCLVPLVLGTSACGNGAITTYSCSVDCPDGTHQQLTINPDGGDACVAALTAVCGSDIGMCSCGGSN
jgi:uncharacterized membrane-anchored protein